MRFSYKKLVDRFLIPRPTLIEWQKKSKADKNNWRVKHLNYLREQLIAEEYTMSELSKKPIRVEDIFLIAVCMFFSKKLDYTDRDTFKLELREFGILKEEGVEYQHDFAKKIWSIKLDDGSNRKISNYYNTIEMIDTLTYAQYLLLMRLVEEYVHGINNKLKPSYTNLLAGLTWQELHMYDKALNNKSLIKHFTGLGILKKTIF